MKVYINGDLVEEADAKISVFDHGLLYGDGVFEGIRIYDGCVFRLEAHLERLNRSAKAIMLNLPWSRDELSEAVCNTCRANGLRDGYIRLVVTRGAGTLGLNPTLCKDPTLIVIADKVQLYPDKYYKEGLKIITVSTRRINPGAVPPKIKSLNYLNNILAKSQAIQSGCMEAVMLNDQGFVAECTGENIFTVSKGIVYTPDTSAGALDGITRQVAMEIAEEKKVPLRETNLTTYDLWTADECFLTGTAAEIVPVTEIDGRKVGEGRPGPVTLSFMKEFRGRVSSDGTLL